MLRLLVLPSALPARGSPFLFSIVGLFQNVVWPESCYRQPFHAGFCPYTVIVSVSTASSWLDGSVLFPGEEHSIVWTATVCSPITSVLAALGFWQLGAKPLVSHSFSGAISRSVLNGDESGFFIRRHRPLLEMLLGVSLLIKPT